MNEKDKHLSEEVVKERTVAGQIALSLLKDNLKAGATVEIPIP